MLRLALLLAVPVVVLTGCTAAPESAPTSAPASTGAPVGPAAAPATPASCSSIVLEQGATVSGSDLGTCLGDYLVAAGTGHGEAHTDGGTSSTDWQLADDGVYASSTGAAGQFVVTPTSGWAKIDGAWVEGDITSENANTSLAGVALQLFQVYSSPDTLPIMAASAGEFTVAKASVQLENGSSRDMWTLTATAPFDVQSGWSVSSLQISTDTLGPTVREDVDLTFASYSGPATSFYSRWGVPIDTSVIADVAGVSVP